MPNLGKDGSRKLVKAIRRRVQKDLKPRATQEQSSHKVPGAIIFGLHIISVSSIRPLLETRTVVGDSSIIITNCREQLDMRDKPPQSMIAILSGSRATVFNTPNERGQLGLSPDHNMRINKFPAEFVPVFTDERDGLFRS